MTALGDIDPFSLEKWEGFDYPEAARVTGLLGNGSAVGGNAMVQQSALAYPRAEIDGTLTDAADLVLMRGYAENKDVVGFVYGADTYLVMVFDLKIVKAKVADDEVWAYSCTLYQVSFAD